MTPRAEHLHTALTEQIPRTLPYPRDTGQAHAGGSAYAPGVATCPYAWMPNSWPFVLSSRKREDESIPRAAWLLRHSLGGFQGERIHPRVQATGLRMCHLLAQTVQSSPYKGPQNLLKYSKPGNLSHSKALNQLKQLKLI